MTSLFSSIVVVLAGIVVFTLLITLIVAVFSYIGFKIRQRRKPEMEDELPDFFWRFTPDMFLLPPALEARAIAAGERRSSVPAPAE